MIFFVFKNVIGIILVLWMTGCVSELRYQQAGPAIKIDVTNGNNNDLKILDVVDSHHYVKLETTTESLINKIDKIICRQDKIYVLDAKSAAIIVFDEQGRFLFAIRKKGKGPGEYTYLRDFDVDEVGNMYLVDLMTKNVLKYSPKGTYISTIAQHSYVSNIAMLDSATYVTYLLSTADSNFDNMLVLRNEEEVIGSYMKADNRSNELYSLKMNSLLRSKDILFNRDLSDTIFALDHDGVYPKYFLDFGDYSIKPSKRNNRKSFMVGLPNIKEGYSINNFYETSDYFTCSFNLKSKSWSLYYAKDSGNFIFFDCAGCYGDTIKVLGYMNARAVSGDYFVSVLTYDNIAPYKENIAGKDTEATRAMLGAENIRFISEFQPQDNPVLVFYSLSKF